MQNKFSYPHSKVHVTAFDHMSIAQQPLKKITKCIEIKALLIRIKF